MKDMYKSVAFCRETWFHRIVAWLEGDTSRIDSPVSYLMEMEEDEMSQLKNANAILAVLHVGEALADLTVDRHSNGEHVTIGDVANVISSEAPKAVAEAGIADHVWRPAPPKRGGPRKAVQGESPK